MSRSVLLAGLAVCLMTSACVEQEQPGAQPVQQNTEQNSAQTADQTAEQQTSQPAEPPPPRKKLSAEEISQLGKAATASIVMPNRRGVAFCVHPSGMFVTNWLAVRDVAHSTITLNLDPGTENQRPITARLFRFDSDHDLALFQATTAGDFPALELGSNQEITELLEIFAFGCKPPPAGPRVKGSLPTIGALAGRVTSLEHDANNELQRFHLDVNFPNEHWGGPVLDEYATVVGVLLPRDLSIGSRGGAVPVSHLMNFLKRPELFFFSQPLTQSNLALPQHYQVRVTPVLPITESVNVELVLKIGAQPERKLNMELDGDLYRASTVLVPEKTAAVLDASITFQKGVISGELLDQEFQVGDQKVMLSDCSRIQWLPKPLVVPLQGPPMEVRPAGLDKVNLQVGGKTVPVNLSQATEMDLRMSRGISRVECTVIARQSGKVVAQLERVLPVRGTASSQLADTVKKPIRTQTKPAAKTTTQLPGKVADICVGGGGQFLILHIPELKQLAVFDVLENRIVRSIPLADDKVTFAAGQEKIVIARSEAKVIERWNLQSGEQELTRIAPDNLSLSSILLGHASAGPLMIDGKAFDLETLEQLPIKEMNQHIVKVQTISANGGTLGGWSTNLSPTLNISFVLSDGAFAYADARDTERGHIVPSPDGRVLHTAQGICTHHFQPITGEPGRNRYCLPATSGDLYLVLNSSRGRIALNMLGHQQPLIADTGITAGIRVDKLDRAPFGPWKRVFLIPEANLIVVLPEANDHLDLYPINITAALKASPLDYLLVTSQPPSRAFVGKALEYSLVVQARQADLTYRLDAGPPGMEVSSDGVVRWNVPANSPEVDESVILTISNTTGQEILHTFKLRVVK